MPPRDSERGIHRAFEGTKTMHMHTQREGRRKTYIRRQKIIHTFFSSTHSMPNYFSGSRALFSPASLFSFSTSGHAPRDGGRVPPRDSERACGLRGCLDVCGRGVGV